MKVETVQWNKIVRDGIPQLIEDSGGKSEIRIVDDKEEFDQLMRFKLAEEVLEVQEADSDHLLEELGDLETIVDTLLSLHGFSRDNLINQQAQKDTERGKFGKRIFLISTKG